jgi:hypothetical protein
MTERAPEIGSVAWTDLTVNDIIQDPAGAVCALIQAKA